MSAWLRILRWLLPVLLLPGLGPLDSRAQPPGVSLEEPATPAPLVVQRDTIVTFRASVAGITPSRRAEVARERLETMRPSKLLGPIRIEPVGDGKVVLVGDAVAFLIAPGDVDPRAGQTIDGTAEDAARRLRRALEQRAKLLTPARRLRAALEAVGATLVLLALLWLLQRTRRFALGWVSSKSQQHQGRFRLGDVDILSQVSAAGAYLAKLLTQVADVVLIGIWAVFLLGLFPETAHWSAGAGLFLLGLLQTFQAGVLRAVPGIVAVLVIVILARFATRLSAQTFAGIERGTIRVRGVHPETAGATRRLVSVLIWVFALVLAYPFLPGSDSAAFKGVSVFLGLLVTLGSSGVVGHMMSGLVLVYSRALRPGDWVRVGEIEGIVSEVGALSVKIANLKNEEFTIPNTVMVSTTIKNYSRLGIEGGSPLTTSVTIGYDAPWRVVHEMLLAAADRTPGIRKQPSPIVIQSALSDFFVEYQLVVRLEEANRRVMVLSQLHQNIQDAFNERGVQIMSPHFEGQPDRPVVVAKAKWTVAPGDREGSGSS